MPFKIVDKQDRKRLTEGRTSGIGFAFCKREGDVLTTIQPISPCKDYLNDVVYTEHTGNPYSAYGLTTKKQDLFSDGFAYIVMSILGNKHGGGNRADHGSLVAAINNPTNLQIFMAFFEPRLCKDHVTVFFNVEDNKTAAVLPLFWVKYPYLISLWSLLVRIGLKYKEGDGMAFLKKVSDEDAYMAKGIIPKLERLMAGELPVQDMGKTYDVHNHGIYTFPFPAK